jgi:RNA polymerase sigma-70 factor (ECF subfamily)
MVSMDDDSRLLDGLRGERPEAAQALQELFFSYAQRLIHFARRFSLDRESAEDVVQNVFLALWRNRQSSTIGGNLKVYLFTAVRNQALNLLRHSKVVREGEQTLQLEVPEPSNNFDRLEYEQLRQAIQQAVNGLPDQCKKIFLMSRLDGLTYGQIAASLDLSVKTVETQMGRALKHLRSVIAAGMVISAALQICRFLL